MKKRTKLNFNKFKIAVINNLASIKGGDDQDVKTTRTSKDCPTTSKDPNEVCPISGN
ncbi:hypothetical protein [Aquimarina celericrescens]|uniref:Uncharacterized protein n=1 Tax=Aquimarina celericrescens TaxID=1964542 RepID=A0ABW5AYG0_9FLAO|nr:hypothetical protein [Aquimarina celericrescens]